MSLQDDLIPQRKRNLPIPAKLSQAEIERRYRNTISMLVTIVYEHQGSTPKGDDLDNSTPQATASEIYCQNKKQHK